MSHALRLLGYRRAVNASALVVALSVLAAATGVSGAPRAPARSTVGPAVVGDASWKDFDGDGFADLAIGVPLEGVGIVDAAGVVHVLYGGPDGLTTAGRQVWHQNRPNVAEQVEEDDHFGWALASGDFDDDGFGDLAIGVPDEDVAGDEDQGGVNILHGSENGLVANASQPFRTVTANGADRVGAALAALDVVDLAAPSAPATDGLADLAVGIPGRDTSQLAILSGRLLDPAIAVSQSHAISLQAGAGGQAGFALAAGDFDADPTDDLAVGAPGADVGPGDSRPGSGALFTVHNGSEEQVTTWVQGDMLPGAPEVDDNLGWSVATGDIDGDGFDDIAVGAPHEDLAGQRDAGLVGLLLSSAGVSQLHRNSAGVPGGISIVERFGASLEIANLGRGARKDLVLGVPGTDVEAAARAGAVVVMYAAGAVFATADNQEFTQATPGIAGAPELNDRLGFAVYAANFDASGRNDLAIGIPHDTVGEAEVAGSVEVLYSRSDGLTVAGDQRWTQGPAGETPERDDQFGASLP